MLRLHDSLEGARFPPTPAGRRGLVRLRAAAPHVHRPRTSPLSEHLQSWAVIFPHSFARFIITLILGKTSWIMCSLDVGLDLRKENNNVAVMLTVMTYGKAVAWCMHVLVFLHGQKPSTLCCCWGGCAFACVRVQRHASVNVCLKITSSTLLGLSADHDVGNYTLDLNSLRRQRIAQGILFT